MPLVNLLNNFSLVLCMATVKHGECKLKDEWFINIDIEKIVFMHQRFLISFYLLFKFIQHGRRDLFVTKSQGIDCKPSLRAESFYLHLL